MHNPSHPGKLIKSVLLENAGLSVTEAAELLGVTRVSLSRLVNCHCGLSLEMAMRISIALNTSIEMWLNLQQNYDLWQIEKKRKHLKNEVTRITKASNTMHLKTTRKIKSIKIKNQAKASKK